jgi:UDP-glucuronate 4-epimerase
MKILITGTAGFIGFHVANRLLNDGHEVAGIDSINDYYDPNLKYDRLYWAGIDKKTIDYRQPALSTRFPSYSFYRGELEDKNLLEEIFKNESPQVVINPRCASWRTA